VWFSRGGEITLERKGNGPRVGLKRGGTCRQPDCGGGQDHVSPQTGGGDSMVPLEAGPAKRQKGKKPAKERAFN